MRWIYFLADEFWGLTNMQFRFKCACTQVYMQSAPCDKLKMLSRMNWKGFKGFERWDVAMAQRATLLSEAL